MDLEKSLTSAQRKAAQKVYFDKYKRAFESELRIIADREGQKEARRLVKTDKFQKELTALVRKWFQKNLTKLVDLTMRDRFLL